MINVNNNNNLASNEHFKAQNVDELISDNFAKTLEHIKTHISIQIPRLEYLQAYAHGQNVAIKSRIRKDKYAANYQIAHNFGEMFVAFDTGYNVTEPITLKIETKDENIIENFKKQNNIQSLDAALWSDVSTYGRAYELHYFKNSQHKVNFSSVFNTFVIYDTSIELEPIAAVRYKKTSKSILKVNFYTKDYLFELDGDKYGKLKVVRKLPHGFNDLPLIEYFSNNKRMGIFEASIPLIDAYDAAVSDIANYSEDTTNAMLVIKGLKLDDYISNDTGQPAKISNMLQDYKNANILYLSDNTDMGAPQKAEAYYIYKQYDVAGMQAHKSRLLEQIYNISKVPNLTDIHFSGNSSGIAMKYKLLFFKQYSGVRQNNFNKSLTRRYRLVDENLKFIEFHYCENLPNDDIETLEALSRCGVQISQESKLKLAPFIKNPKEELERIKEEKQKNIDTLMTPGGLLDA